MLRDNPSAPLVLAVALWLSGTTAATAAGPTVRDLDSCRRLAERAPLEALAAVKDWAAHGGGDQARLCRAEALFQSGDYSGAGDIFETLATGGARSDRQIADLYDHAGWAFLRAGATERAEFLYSRALDKMPDDAELRIDRGIARSELGKYRDAVADFTHALGKQPDRPDAYYFRAVAYRELTDLKNAREDIEHSLRLRPGNAEALVLRGTIRAQTGDKPGARLDWQEVIRRGADTPAARGAAVRLKRLDE